MSITHTGKRIFDTLAASLCRSLPSDTASAPLAIDRVWTLEAELRRWFQFARQGAQRNRGIAKYLAYHLRPSSVTVAHSYGILVICLQMETRAYMPVPPGVGMEENFLSLDDILLSQETLPCRTESPFPRLGFLEKCSETPDIPEGTKMEMPLWLAKGLYERKRRVLSVDLPKVYRESWRTVFGADPNVVDLHKMGPYYYGLGSQLLHFDSPENLEIAQTTLNTFIGRFRRTMDSSQNAFNEDTSGLVEHLDCLEKALFQAGQSGLNSFQCWETGRASHLTASSLVINYRKRKIAEVQE